MNGMPGAWVLVGWGFLEAFLGCVGGSSRGEAFYPTPNGPLPREQVAQIGGYVARVDGREATGHGGLVEVLPGCHIVVTPKEWGMVGAMSGMTITTGHRAYAMPMKAGYRYSVDIHVPEAHGPTGRVAMEAYEQDASGNKTQTFPLAGEEDVRKCLTDLAPTQPPPEEP
jgi:hypothetical protein